MFDENDWADLDGPIASYAKSKTLSELAAWKFVREPREHQLELVAMNPVYVLGPSLTGADNASNDIVRKLPDGSQVELDSSGDNGLLTLRGAWHKLRTDPVLKFMAAAVTFYG